MPTRPAPTPTSLIPTATSTRIPSKSASASTPTTREYSPRVDGLFVDFSNNATSHEPFYQGFVARHEVNADPAFDPDNADSHQWRRPRANLHRLRPRHHPRRHLPGPLTPQFSRRIRSGEADDRPRASAPTTAPSPISSATGSASMPASPASATATSNPPP